MKSLIPPASAERLSVVASRLETRKKLSIFSVAAKCAERITAALLCSVAIFLPSWAEEPEVDWAYTGANYYVAAANDRNICNRIVSAMNDGRSHGQIYSDPIFLRWEANLPHMSSSPDGIGIWHYLVVDLFNNESDVALVKLRSETGYRGEGLWYFPDVKGFLNKDWQNWMKRPEGTVSDDWQSTAISRLIQNVKRSQRAMYHISGDDAFWQRTNFIGEKQINVARVQSINYLVVRQVLETEDAVAVFNLARSDMADPVCYLVPDNNRE